MCRIIWTEIDLPALMKLEKSVTQFLQGILVEIKTIRVNPAHAKPWFLHDTRRGPL